ncbi:hypothetical protein [Actinomadura rugatobispora]|uniref:ABC transporter permease n=1 Tax=Actinomadura rugatobispora TaxID=1994 RepID=A0ABW1A8W1_9ACTN|nr:hypothetical protein GCM10010200_075080 [Actinomadura rugatobispora]
MRRPTVRAFRTWAVTTLIIALLGAPAGLLWTEISPKVTYIVVQGQALLAEPEGQGPIGVDGRFALVAVVAGVLCGVGGYLAGGRGNDLPLIFGLAAGGLAASLVAWRLGHQIGLDAFQRAVRRAPDGRTVTGVAQLRATGILVFWPLLAVAVYGVLEVLVKRLPSGDRGERGTGQADEVGGGQLDLQAAPTGRDVDRGER